MSLPTVSEGVLPKAGSLAIAVGEIMCAYRYPETFEGDTLPWPKMEPILPKVDGIFDVKTRSIRSKFIKRLGDTDNLDMHYGRNYSYASPENVARTFTSFGYSNGGELKVYESKEVMAEVKSGYITIIGGTPTASQDNKHFWIADGCKEVTRVANIYNENHELVDTLKQISQYLQYNWGCNGEHNGYYAVNAFNAKMGVPKQIVLIETGDSVSYAIPFSRSIDDELQNYKYNLQAITGIRR